MLAWERIGKAVAPGGKELILLRRGEHFEIRAGGEQLMSSFAHASEDELAQVVCGALADRRAPRVLVGGLGFGYTLRAALDCLPRAATVVVAELVPEVVEWNRGVLAPLAGNPLDDHRTRIEVADVARVIEAAKGDLDAVLLDVDNGPEALTGPSNAWLYSADGLGACRRALAPGGVLAVWSARPYLAFERRLRQAGFHVHLRSARAASRGRGAHHAIYLATASGDGRPPGVARIVAEKRPRR